MRTRIHHRYMYVWPMETLHGFQYRGYTNSLTNPPKGFVVGPPKVNLKKR